MQKHATLLILAAGLGSRYGGIKQMDPVNPEGGEFILDYSIFDARRAGFDKFVLVIRKELEAPLREHFQKAAQSLDIQYAVQDMNDLPEGFSVPAGRTKPWGTAHAIRAARHLIDTPFAAINADDFYGAKTFQVLADFLLGDECAANLWAMVAFQMKNTLSEKGTVSRGICTVKDGFLTNVVEHTKIEAAPGGARSWLSETESVPFTGEEPVSMNFWGFTPELFPQLERLFRTFLAERGQEMKSEFFIPSVVDTLIKEGLVRARVLTTPERWFGMTYTEDRLAVIAKVRELTEAGLYPARLWE